MRRDMIVLMFIALAALFVALSVSNAIALAQSGNGFDLTWSTIDGGGGSSGGGLYSLAGTIGQPDAGLLGGGGYTLNGGFWNGAAPGYRVYLPLVLR
jgi:hypothetical protein